jgi:hypothetical protein
MADHLFIGLYQSTKNSQCVLASTINVKVFEGLRVWPKDRVVERECDLRLPAAAEEMSKNNFASDAPILYRCAIASDQELQLKTTTLPGSGGKKYLPLLGLELFGIDSPNKVFEGCHVST